VGGYSLIGKTLVFKINDVGSSPTASVLFSLKVRASLFIFFTDSKAVKCGGLLSLSIL
jgi:hypothetical protein